MPTPLQTDRDLLSRFQAGDDQAFELLFRRYRRRLWGMARRMGRDTQQAEDILVEAMAAVAVQARRGGIRGSFIGYSLTAVHRRGLHVLERRNERDAFAAVPLVRCVASGGPNPEEALARADLRDEVWSALEDLPVAARDAVYLVDCQGMTYCEAAESLSCSEATVKRRLRVARRSLAIRLNHLRPSEKGHDP